LTLDFLLEISYISMFLGFGLWVFFYKLVYVFMFLSLGLLVGFPDFLCFGFRPSYRVFRFS